jgi:hypothetical protein
LVAIGAKSNGRETAESAKRKDTMMGQNKQIELQRTRILERRPGVTHVHYRARR